MPKLRINCGANSTPGASPGSPLPGWDTAIEVDGKPLLDTTDIRLHFPVDGPARADVRLLLTDEPFEFAGDVDLHLHVHLPEGATMDEVTAPGDTNRSFIVIRKGQ